MNELEIMRMHEAGPMRPAFDPYEESRRGQYTESGWVCLLDGHFVPDGDALAEAEEACGFRMVQASAPDAAEFMQMAVEWYFSGNFRRVEAGDEKPDFEAAV